MASALRRARLLDLWVLGVVASLALPSGLTLAGAPPWIGVVAAVALALGGIGDLISDTVMSRRRTASGHLRDGLADTGDQIEREELAERTHGHLHPAAQALVRAREYLDDHAGPVTVVDEALSTITELDRRLRLPRRSVGIRRRGAAPLVGGIVAARAANPRSRYSDVTNLPRWIRSPTLRASLLRIGGVLDDVRDLHDVEIEWAVLLFTLWMRLLFVAFAPWLAGASFGVTPLAPAGPTILAVPWAMATAWAFGTAVAAPRLADAVMDRGEEGVRTRRWLLWVEVPLTLALLLATPCWPVVAFATGWTNWWQRPAFSWVRLAVWIAIIAAVLTLAGALHAIAPVALFAEAVIGMFVVALIGGSYGALLPVSSSLATSVVVGGLVAPRRARRRADDQIGEAVALLHRVADAVNAGDGGAGSLATAEATHLRRVARELADRADRDDRWAWRRPLGLGALLDDALDRAGPRADTAAAHALAEHAELVGDGPPVTLLDAQLWDEDVRRLRLPNRRAASRLSALIVEVVAEARRHGTGPLRTDCRREGDELVLRFINRIPPGGGAPGNGSGAARLRGLADRCDARIAARGPIDGPRYGIPPGAKRYVVELRSPWPRR